MYVERLNGVSTVLEQDHFYSDCLIPLVTVLTSFQNRDDEPRTNMQWEIRVARLIPRSTEDEMFAFEARRMCVRLSDSWEGTF